MRDRKENKRKRWNTTWKTRRVSSTKKELIAWERSESTKTGHMVDYMVRVEEEKPGRRGNGRRENKKEWIGEERMFNGPQRSH